MTPIEPLIISDAIRTFHKLHEAGCFVLPNPWDEGTARYLHQLGYKALATTSAGLAFSLGQPDLIGRVPLEVVLEHVRKLVQATPLPVNVDFQEGYADTPEGVAANVTRCVATGAAGLSIEDNSGKRDQPLFPRAEAIERLKAARAAIDATGIPVLLTGRCEAFLVGDETPLQTALDRLVAYAEAGADCLYAPGLQKAEDIEMLVKAVHPKPLNVLCSRADTGFTVAQLASLGVRRISVGSAMARVAWGAFMRSAQQIIDEGRFDDFANAASFPELNKLFEPT